MSAYLITGPSGTGKSTTGRVLKRWGFEVIDTDFAEGLSSWIEIESGQVVDEPGEQPYSQEWLDRNEWIWNPDRMNELLDGSSGKTVFFCGGAKNEHEFYNRFKLRFGLVCDNPTLVDRLRSRDQQRWIPGSIELDYQLEWNTKYTDFCHKSGAILINTLVAPEFIAYDIISHTIDNELITGQQAGHQD